MKKEAGEILNNNQYIKDGYTKKQWAEMQKRDAKRAVDCHDAKTNTISCKCGKYGKQQYDNGLKVGIMCDTCFNNMVAKCRERSW